MKTLSLNQIKDKFIGQVGTPKRDHYEFELKVDLIGLTLKKLRKKRNLTQAELGQLIGVQKAQISKLEKGSQNVTIATVLKVFNALDAKIKFQVELVDKPMTA
ncbi:MAG: helix-turn-helix domain-containing protein [Chitinophagales bacterium]